MRIRFFCSILTMTAFAAASAACHSQPPPVAPTIAPTPASPLASGVRPPPPPRSNGPSLAAPMPPSPSEADLFRRKSLDELNAERPLTDAFFDYDQSTLRDDARTALNQDATWLLKWTQTTIRVSGHCDERGTAEYNLALGQRRAAAVRDYLVSLGVDTARITTNSLGKEQPFCTTSDEESCHAQNRRGHFYITAK